MWVTTRTFSFDPAQPAGSCSAERFGAVRPAIPTELPVGLTRGVRENRRRTRRFGPVSFGRNPPTVKPPPFAGTSRGTSTLLRSPSSRPSLCRKVQEADGTYGGAWR